MSKKKIIAELEQRIAVLEQDLEEKSIPVENPPVKTRGKNSINVYMDSDFFRPLVGSEKERLVIRERHEITQERPQYRSGESRLSGAKPKKQSRWAANLWKFVKGFFRVLFVLLVIALILAIVALIGLAIVWALVNFNVVAANANPFIDFCWKAIGRIFRIFGYQVPRI